MPIRRKLLLVEDDKDIRGSLIALLEEEGFQVVEASNGMEALDAMRANLPDLVLLDLKMPHMTGAEFRSTQLREPGLRGVPVIIISALENLEARAATLGITTAIRKPIDIQELLDAIKHHLQIPVTERRRSPRKPATLPVQWIRQGRVLDLIASDLNAHGLFLVTHEQAPIGMLMHLQVALPGGTISLYARVVALGKSDHGNGIGVAFYLMGPDERQRWLQYYWAVVQEG